MLYNVEVTASQGATLSLSLINPTNGLLVENIDGLDPVKVNIVSSAFASVDEEQYQSARREKRNIIITLGLDPDFSSTTVRALRKELYKFFMPKREVLLRFEDSDLSSVEIRGRIEDFDSDLFTKDPTVTISILCLNSDFYDPNITIFPGGTVSSLEEVSLEYIGDVDTGVIFQLNVNRSVNGFTIYQRE